MGRCWSFRGDDELDPMLKKWSKQNEKSFHIREALRKYLSSREKFVQISFDEHVQTMPVNEGELFLEDWK